MNNQIWLYGKPNEYVKVFCQTTEELRTRIFSKFAEAEPENEDYFRNALTTLDNQTEDDYVVCFQHHGNCMPEHLCEVFPFFVDHGFAYACSQNEDAHWYCSYFLVRDERSTVDRLGREIFTDALTGKKFCFYTQRGSISSFSLNETVKPSSD